MSNHDDRQAVPKNSKADKPILTLDHPPSPIFQFDAEEYIGQFDGYDLSEEQKIEILQNLWQIMCRFVELGFGMDSYSNVCEQSPTNSSFQAEDLV